MKPQFGKLLANAIVPDAISMFKLVHRHQQTDFSALELFPFYWDIKHKDPAVEKKTMRFKRDLNDASLIHHNLDIEAVQRFCGGRFMGEHC